MQKSIPHQCLPSALSLTDSNTLSSVTEYHQVIGSLQYLTLTRPNVAFAVNKLAQFMHMHKPTDIHWATIKRLIHYLKSITHLGLFLCRDSLLDLHAFFDADWGGNKDD